MLRECTNQTYSPSTVCLNVQVIMFGSVSRAFLCWRRDAEVWSHGRFYDATCLNL